MTRDELTCYLQDYLACDAFDDYAPNGLQVEGKTKIARICTAVTASEAIIKQAVSQQADALLVHHGYFWRGEEPAICGMKRSRIGQLITHDINLFAYHLPLDCHLELGNNARLGNILDINAIKTHPVGKTKDLLWSGTLKEPVAADTFARFIEKKLNRKPLHVLGTDKPIQHIAWCTGAAQDFIDHAKRLGADAYLSGEISERTYYQAKELGIDYFACGHHATERYGIQALGEHISQHFGIQHQFIDTDNPV